MTQNQYLISLANKIKTASAVDDFKNELNNAKSKAEVDAIYNKYKGALRREPTQQDWEVICNIKKSQLPAADDGQFADDKDLRGNKDGLIYRTLNTLSGLADDLDNNGFEKLAKCIDELIKKISEEAF